METPRGYSAVQQSSTYIAQPTSNPTDGQSRKILFTSILDSSRPDPFTDRSQSHSHDITMASGQDHHHSKPPSLVNEAVLLHHDGEEPDHKEPIPWRTWAICLLCALAQFQNTVSALSSIAGHVSDAVLLPVPRVSDRTG